MALQLGPVIGTIGGGAGGAYGQITTTTSMPRSWQPIPWDTGRDITNSTFTAPADGDYIFVAVILKDSTVSSRNAAMRIVVNETVEHTTDATAPGVLLHTVNLNKGDEIVVEVITDNPIAAAREIQPGSTLGIIRTV